MTRRALALFAAAGTSFLIAVFGVASSGAGPAAEAAPGALVALTWLAVIATPALLLAAAIVAILALVAPDQRTRGERRGRRQPNATRQGVASQVERASAERRAVLVVLMLLGAGASVLWAASAQRPSPDQLPFGLALLGIGIIALIVVVGRRLVGVVRTKIR